MMGRRMRQLQQIAALCVAVVLIGAANAQEFHRVSMGVTGSIATQGDLPQISGDGSTVGFMSFYSNLVADDEPGMDLFLYDRSSGITDVANPPSIAGATGSGGWHSQSVDGRYVAFVSNYGGPTAHYSNGYGGVIVRDRVTGTAVMASVSSLGVQANSSSSDPKISENGQYVIYWSLASNLVDGDNNGTWDVFVHILATSQTLRIEADSANYWAGDHLPDVSSDGRFVVFYSDSGNLVAGDTNGVHDVFLHDLQTGVTEIISQGHDGSPADGASNHATISGDSRYVSYITSATNIVAAPYPAWAVVLHDRIQGTSQIVSLSSAGDAFGNVSNQVISKDGRFVAFQTWVDGYVPEDSNGHDDIYRHEISSGTTQIVTWGFDGSATNNSSGFPAISADGSIVAFSSAAVNLVDGAYDYSSDPLEEAEWKVYAYNFNSGQTEAISRPLQPNEPPQESSFASISGDGQKLVFSSDVDNFVLEEEDGRSDIFVYDVPTKAIQRIKQPVVSGFSRTNSFPELSAQGNRMTYVSIDVNESTAQFRFGHYLYDFVTDTHTSLNVTPGGLPGNDRCAGLSDLDQSGSAVVFACQSSDLVPGDTNDTSDVFVRNPDTQLTRRVSIRSDGQESDDFSSKPSISEDGRMVSFASFATNLVNSDLNGVRDIFLHDIFQGTTIRVSETPSVEANGESFDSRVSANGELVVFISEATNLTADLSGAFKNIFLYDVETGAIELLTKGWDGSMADGPSVYAEFSTDGKFITISTSASNIVPDDNNGVVDLFLYEVATGAIQRISQNEDGTGGNGDSEYATVSDNARVIAIQTYATNFGWLDTNGERDIYLKENIDPLATLATRMVGLDDVNNNGSADVAVAVPGSTRVHIRDGSTDGLISDINFGSDPAFDMAVVPDLDASGNPEIAVMGERPSGQIRVQVKDSVTGAATGTVFYGDVYSGIDMTVVPDFSGNGLAELAVLGQEPGTDKIRVMVRDVATDTGIKSLFLGNRMTAHNVTVVSDVTGNTIPEIAMTGVIKTSDQVQSQVRDANTAGLHQTVFWANQFLPVKTITMQDIDSSGSEELVALGRDPITGAGRLQIRDATTRSPITTAFLGTTSEVLDVVVIVDTNANGFPDIAVLSRQGSGAGLVRVYDSGTGTLLKNVFYNTLDNPVGLVALADFSGNAADELAVLGDNAGVRQVQVKDSSAGNLVNSIDFP